MRGRPSVTQKVVMLRPAAVVLVTVGGVASGVPGTTLAVPAIVVEGVWFERLEEGSKEGTSG